MDTSQKIHQALARVHALVSEREQNHILHTTDLTRADRELLVRTGWLREVTKGWYLLARPDARPGDSSAWYANFWNFLEVYLARFFAKRYCLSAENSLDLHLGNTVVPKQVIVMALKGRGAPLTLPFDTSLLIYAVPAPLPKDRVEMQKLQVMSLPYALCKVSPFFFQRHPQEAEIALHSIQSSDELLRVIAENNFIRAAGRLIAAYRFIGREAFANELLEGVDHLGMKVEEINPFSSSKPLITSAVGESSYAVRIQAMWEHFRGDVINHFPKPPAVDPLLYMKNVEEQYLQDAYHSLSIEGYQVKEALIKKVKSADWNPEEDDNDRELRNTLAARGYYEAFLEVKKTLAKLIGQSPLQLDIQSSVSSWYRQLFAPSVTAGIIQASDLFGYRRNQVYICQSRHTPPPAHALPSAMEAFYHCLENEDHPAVRAVLGHFIFVFIHPYMDGNGRIGRFLMNVMLATGGYPWTIIHLEKRHHYLKALESASVEKTIIPLTQFIRSELERSS